MEDETGRDIPAASIAVTDGDTMNIALQALQPLALARTDERGRFVIERLSSGSRLVAASAAGFIPAFVPVSIGQGADGTDVRLTLRHGGVTISGRVSEPSGGPIAGALVGRIPSGFPGDRAAIYSAATDERGRYSLTLSPGDHLLAFSRDGYARRTIEVNAHEDQRLDMRLLPAAVLGGRVVTSSNVPVAAAHVSLRALRSTSDVARTETDDRGNFTLAGLGADRYEIVARLGTQVGSQGPIALGALERREIVIRLGEGGVVSGRVIDPSRKPVANARLLLSRLDHEGPGEPAGSADVNGSFTIRGVLPEHTAILAQASELAIGRRQLSVPPGQSLSGIEIVVPASRELVVAVEREGRPATGSVVAVSVPYFSMEKVVDGDGAARFSGVPVGSVHVSAVVDRGARASQQIAIADQPETRVLLRLEPIQKLTLEGRVAWQGTSRPAPGVPVYVFCQGRLWDRTRTSASGEYVFEACEPGPFDVRAYDRDVSLEEWRAVSDPGARPPLAPGEGRRNVDLSIAPRGKRLSGRVVDSTGQPLADATVTASGDLEEETDLTGRDGTFAINDLTRQPHTVRVKVPGYVGAVQDTGTEDRTDLSFGLQRGAVLTGLVRQRGGGPVPYARVLARSPLRNGESYTTAAGTFAMADLPSGTYEVSVRYGEPLLDRKVTEVKLAAMQAEHIELVLPDL